MMQRRRPRWVYDVGEEPDPRFSLANERTFLAWIRTCLALLAGAVALYSVGVPGHERLRLVIVGALMLLGAVAVVLAAVRWARVERAMRENGPLPSLTTGLVTAAGLAVIAVVLAVALVLA